MCHRQWGIVESAADCRDLCFFFCYGQNHHCGTGKGQKCPVKINAYTLGPFIFELVFFFFKFYMELLQQWNCYDTLVSQYINAKKYDHVLCMINVLWPKSDCYKVIQVTSVLGFITFIYSYLFPLLCFCRASSCPAWRPHTSSCSWGLGSSARSKVTPTLPSPSPSPFPTRAKMATSGALRISLQVLLPVITLLLSLLLTGSNASKYQETDNFSISVPLTGSSLTSENLLKRGVITKKGEEGTLYKLWWTFFFTLSTSKMLLLHFATAHLHLKIAC